jgi:shikimate kinase
MTEPRRIHNLSLIGFMGSGKTTVGRMLALQLHFEFVDTDEWLERRAGRSITEVFEKEGEERFRVMERELVEEMVHWRGKVIATGGGLGATEANLVSLKTHSLVVCLWAPAELIWQRVRKQSHRPLLQDPDPLARIRSLLETRRPVYSQADVLINSGSRSVREVAAQVFHQFQSARPRREPGENQDPTASH